MTNPQNSSTAAPSDEQIIGMLKDISVEVVPGEYVLTVEDVRALLAAHPVQPEHQIGAMLDEMMTNARLHLGGEFKTGFVSAIQDLRTRLAKEPAAAPVAHSDAQVAQVPVKQWPFVESPGNFASRMSLAIDNCNGDVLAACRTVLIEQPPTLSVHAMKTIGESGWYEDGTPGKLTVESILKIASQCGIPAIGEIDNPWKLVKFANLLCASQPTAAIDVRDAALEELVRNEFSKYTYGECNLIQVRENIIRALKSAPSAQAAEVHDLRDEVARLNQIINSPQSGDFLRAVSTEAEHQRQRWGNSHDAGKAPADWFWLIGYLAGKALAAHNSGDTEKAEHHIITTAAALYNWHLSMFGGTDMRPGIDGEAAMQPSTAEKGASK